MEERFKDALYILNEGNRACKDDVIKHYDCPVSRSLEPGERVLEKLHDEQGIRDIAIKFERRVMIQNEGLAVEALYDAFSMRDLKVNQFHSLS